jgi:hypothetical protein
MGRRRTAKPSDLAYLDMARLAVAAIGCATCVWVQSASLFLAGSSDSKSTQWDKRLPRSRAIRELLTSQLCTR